jgi:hypothetical protein
MKALLVFLLFSSEFASAAFLEFAVPIARLPSVPQRRFSQGRNFLEPEVGENEDLYLVPDPTLDISQRFLTEAKNKYVIYDSLNKKCKAVRKDHLAYKSPKELIVVAPFDYRVSFDSDGDVYKLEAGNFAFHIDREKPLIIDITDYLKIKFFIGGPKLVKTDLQSEILKLDSIPTFADAGPEGVPDAVEDAREGEESEIQLQQYLLDNVFLMSYRQWLKAQRLSMEFFNPPIFSTRTVRAAARKPIGFIEPTAEEENQVPEINGIPRAKAVKPSRTAANFEERKRALINATLSKIPSRDYFATWQEDAEVHAYTYIHRRIFGKNETVKFEREERQLRKNPLFGNFIAYYSGAYMTAKAVMSPAKFSEIFGYAPANMGESEAPYRHAVEGLALDLIKTRYPEYWQSIKEIE